MSRADDPFRYFHSSPDNPTSSGLILSSTGYGVPKPSVRASPRCISTRLTPQAIVSVRMAPGGAHGRSNDIPEMRALFIACGPAFKKDTDIGLIDNIEVYPLLRMLLGLPAADTIDVLVGSPDPDPN